MTVAAAGTLTKALDNVRHTLASIPAVRTWLGAGSESAALERIHLMCLPPPSDLMEYTASEMEAYRPFVTVHPPIPATRFTPAGLGVGEISHGAEVVFEASPTATYSATERIPTQDARITAHNRMGEVLSGIADYMQAAGYVGGVSGEVAGPFVNERGEAQTVGPYIQYTFHLEWGGR